MIKLESRLPRGRNVYISITNDNSKISVMIRSSLLITATLLVSHSKCMGKILVITVPYIMGNGVGDQKSHGVKELTAVQRRRRSWPKT